MRFKSVTLFGWHLDIVVGCFAPPSLHWHDRQTMRQKLRPGFHRGKGFATFVRGDNLVTVNWRRA